MSQSSLGGLCLSGSATPGRPAAERAGRVQAATPPRSLGFPRPLVPSRAPEFLERLLALRAELGREASPGRRAVRCRETRRLDGRRPLNVQ